MVNCVDDLVPGVLGYAESVVEEDHRGTKYVVIDGAPSAKAVTIVIGGFDGFSLDLRECACRAGLRALKDAIEVGKVLPGAGACQIEIRKKLLERIVGSEMGKERFGVMAFAEAMLSIPRALLRNSGWDCAVKIAEMEKCGDEGELAGIDLETGEVIDPVVFGVWDRYSVVRGIVRAAPVIASQVLLVDEIIENGKTRKKDE
jgi:T-complex protein 1 subunit zeta